MRNLILTLSLLAALAAWVAVFDRTTMRPLPADTALSGVPSAAQMRYDVQHYDLKLRVVPAIKWIIGINQIRLKALEPLDSVELDLDTLLSVDAVRQDDRVIRYTRKGGKLTAILDSPLAAGEETVVSVSYRGYPHIAARAPWDGGFVWSETPSGQPWIATAVQGDGCDLWWPCKDVLDDKPDAMTITVDVPEGLVAATNGVLESAVEAPGGGMRYVWNHPRPITPYLVALNIAPYVAVERSYTGINGTEIPVIFYALPENITKAEALVDGDLIPQLRFFEETLGPYPFGDMKLGIAETPHLGMEHQTINAYGNAYKPDPYGFDWLLQHELAHEWFGNIMTQGRPRDWWLHEGFGMYMQPVYTEALMGRAHYSERMMTILRTIQNCNPMVPGDLKPGTLPRDHDVYTKGAWVLHTLRHFLGDAVFWRAVRRLIYGTAEPWSLAYPITPKYRTTEDFQQILEDESGQDLGWFFDVYAGEAALPTLSKTHDGDTAIIAWDTPGDLPFRLPIPVQTFSMRLTLPVDGNRHIFPLRRGREQFDKLILDPDMQILRAVPMAQTCTQ